MTDQAAGAAPVIDHRTPPRGVLPRRAQTWVMAGLAIGVLAIVLLAGHPEPRTAPVVASTAAPPSPERLQDYRDRLRILDRRARQQVVDEAAPELVSVSGYQPSTSAPAPDPVQVERQRREYQSLFASNVVLSRRPNGETRSSEPGRQDTALAAFEIEPSTDLGRSPSLDDVADAVVRAAARQGQAAAPSMVAPDAGAPAATAGSTQTARRASTGPIGAAGPLHRLLEGTVIDAVLMNRLDGGHAGPVTCLVTNPVYSHSGQHVLVPAGSRVIGQTTPVQTVGDTRLAVTFHRLVLPDGRTYALDQVMGLNQVGETGLQDQVDHHRWSTVGASGAVGLISGLAQWIGFGGWGGDGDRTVVITGGASNATSQATSQTMSRFLNRLPTVTIREGHRIKVYVTTDLELPAYEPAERGSAPLAGRQLAGGRP